MKHVKRIAILCLTLFLVGGLTNNYVLASDRPYNPGVELLSIGHGNVVD